MEYKLLKHKHQQNIVNCSVDQTDQLFRLARDDGEFSVMKKIIKNNFAHERLLIQNLAIQIYCVTRVHALHTIYDMWKRRVDEEWMFYITIMNS